MISGGLKIFAVLGVGVAVLAWGRPDLFSRFLMPCRAPITYSLGSFDTRFGISESEFLSAVARAEELWENAIGKELFAFAPADGKIGVHLVYDERQETTKELADIRVEVASYEASYDVLRASFESAEARYESDSASYDSRVEAFNAKSEAYDAKVLAWNRGPRTSQTEFNALESDRRALQTERAALERMEGELRRMAGELNTLAEQVNRSADAFNSGVERYNAAGASRGETYTGGTYHEERRERRIEIYEFSSREKLVRILAHELGHALGIDHVDEAGAIMYEFNEGSSVRLAASDIAAVRKLCRTE